jgi:hypothetical protein
MRDNPQIIDYEPVTRSGSTPEETDELDGIEFREPAGSALNDLDTDPSFSAEPDFTEPVVRKEAPSGGTAAKPVSQQKRNQNAILKGEPSSILKKGHAISVFGLFLFTVILYLRPYELIPALSFLSNSAFWIAVVTLIIYIPTQIGLEGRLTVRLREIDFLLLMAAGALLSIPQANEPLRAWDSFTQFMKVVIMFVVLVNVVRTEKRLKALILLAIVVSCISSVDAVNDYRLDRFVLGQHERIQGLLGNLFDNPNDLALHLVTMIPIALALLLGSKALTKKLLYLACAVIFAAGIIATTSRGGFIGLACVVSVLAWKLARRNRALLGGAGLVLVVLLVVFGPGGFKTRMSAGNDASVSARTGELMRSLFLMAHHPLFGLGMNNYILFSNTSHATHNAFTQVGSEIGIPAMIFYIMFLVTPLKRLAEVRRKTDVGRRRGRLYYLGIGIETSIIGYMVTSFFLSVAYLWYAYYLVGYAIALRRLLHQQLELESAEPEKRLQGAPSILQRQK